MVSLLIYDLPCGFFFLSASLNKHKGPVWQLRWMEQDRSDKKETLMCISGDGRMTQWLIQQRLDCFGEHLKLLPLSPADIASTSYPTKHFRAAEFPKQHEFLTPVWQNLLLFTQMWWKSNEQKVRRKNYQVREKGKVKVQYHKRQLECASTSIQR